MVFFELELYSFTTSDQNDLVLVPVTQDPLIKEGAKGARKIVIDLLQVCKLRISNSKTPLTAAIGHITVCFQPLFKESII